MKNQKILTAIMLILLSVTSYGDNSKAPSCENLPIDNSEQAICWGKYHITKTWPSFDFPEMESKAKLQNSVWSVWFYPKEKLVVGGGATAAIDKESGKLLELWANQ